MKRILECVIPQDSGFHSKVIKYATEWRDWFPEDPVHKMIKDAIDKLDALKIEIVMCNRIVELSYLCDTNIPSRWGKEHFFDLMKQKSGKSRM